jgi:tRNA pseudouridine55 synthase
MPFLLIDKPAGITSHDVVDKVRKITGERTVGHAGTLDPFATGLLIVGVGRDCTKQLSTYLGMDKEYEATFVIGATTETLDPEGTVVESLSPAERGVNNPAFTHDGIIAAMAKLTGVISQIPPMHSAIKIGGQKMYKLARKGETVDIPPRTLTIHSFELLEEPNLTTWPIGLKVRISCSSGTYIRALARDLGALLGTTGYVSTLRRTKIGEYSVTSAKTLGELTSPVLRS